jgi:hypothetical protein
MARGNLTGTPGVHSRVGSCVPSSSSPLSAAREGAASSNTCLDAVEAEDGRAQECAAGVMDCQSPQLQSIDTDADADADVDADTGKEDLATGSKAPCVRNELDEGQTEFSHAQVMRVVEHLDTAEAQHVDNPSIATELSIGDALCLAEASMVHRRTRTSDTALGRTAHVTPFQGGLQSPSSISSTTHADMGNSRDPQSSSRSCDSDGDFDAHTHEENPIDPSSTFALKSTGSDDDTSLPIDARQPAAVDEDSPVLEIYDSGDETPIDGTPDERDHSPIESTPDGRDCSPIESTPDERDCSPIEGTPDERDCSPIEGADSDSNPQGRIRQSSGFADVVSGYANDADTAGNDDDISLANDDSGDDGCGVIGITNCEQISGSNGEEISGSDGGEISGSSRACEAGDEANNARIDGSADLVPIGDTVSGGAAAEVSSSSSTSSTRSGRTQGDTSGDVSNVMSNGEMVSLGVEELQKEDPEAGNEPISSGNDREIDEATQILQVFLCSMKLFQ